jgi:hypothetical protein
MACVGIISALFLGTFCVILFVLPDRLTVGPQTLNLSILVRVQVWQPPYAKSGD